MRSYLTLAAALAMASCGGTAPAPGAAPVRAAPSPPAATAATVAPAAAGRPAGPAAIGMPNPASANCAQRGGTLQIVSSAAGQAGTCSFPNGKQCEEWALLRGECSPD
ncbi:putative hemolysin [Cupriavidus sp. USMAA2-4]|uniref:putative hemolysin n=2 Tax=Burkholderiaceae TaxID=119060 RepID=UPI001E2DCA79|nr:DUF333 domain-containing protein [Cupriavidus sp. USMAA2-4]